MPARSRPPGAAIGRIVAGGAARPFTCAFSFAFAWPAPRLDRDHASRPAPGSAPIRGQRRLGREGVVAGPARGGTPAPWRMPAGAGCPGAWVGGPDPVRGVWYLLAMLETAGCAEPRAWAAHPGPSPREPCVGGAALAVGGPEGGQPGRAGAAELCTPGSAERGRAIGGGQWSWAADHGPSPREPSVGGAAVAVGGPEGAQPGRAGAADLCTPASAARGPPRAVPRAPEVERRPCAARRVAAHPPAAPAPRGLRRATRQITAGPKRST